MSVERSGFRRRFRLAGAATAAFALPSSAMAHGFAQRYDLPVPLYLYLAGAGAAVALTFVLAAVLVRGHGAGDYPRFDLLRSRLGRALFRPTMGTVLRIAAVALLGLIVVAGLAGAQHPMRNIAPSLIWIVWWVGLAYVCALLGNLWAVINPWAAVFGWAERAATRIGRLRSLSLGWRYPEPLGVWPAVALFLAFAWIELVWSGSRAPDRLALAVLAYSAITWFGMLAFGRDTWLRSGDPFALFFALLARFSPTEVRVSDPEICRACGAPDCRAAPGGCVDCGDCARRAPPGARAVNLRPFAVGLLSPRPVPPSLMVLVIVMLSTVTFDGLTETPAWVAMLEWLIARIGFAGGAAAVLETIWLLALPLVFLAVYWLFAETLTRRSVGGTLQEIPRGVLARSFVLTLVPISIAYHVAHYLSFLLIAGQLVIPLASDPLGLGWNLFGSRDYAVDIGVVDVRFVWISAVTCIVLGHVAAVWLAHVTAIRIFRDPAAARHSQYPMLVLMVGYTVLSLWILAQPIVEYAPR